MATSRARVLLLLLLATSIALPGANAEETEADETEGTEWSWFGSLRVRPEYNANLSGQSPGEKDEYIAYRANLGASVELDRRMTVVLDVQALGVWGENEFPCSQGIVSDCNDTRAGIFRGYFEARKVIGWPVSVRIGRQPLVFADEFFLGDGDFYAGTSWDAFRVDVPIGKWDLSAFWAKAAETDFTTPDDGRNSDADLTGIWATRRVGPKHRWDAAYLYTQDRRPLPPFSFRDKRGTLVGRYEFDANNSYFVHVNIGHQAFGQTISGDGTEIVDAKAHGMEVTTGYTFFKDSSTVIQVSGRFAQFSGDDAGRDGINDSYFPIAIDGHARYGFLDYWTGPFGGSRFVGAAPGLQIVQLRIQSENHSGYRLVGILQTQRADEPFGPRDSHITGVEYGIGAYFPYGRNLTLELAAAELRPSQGFKEEITDATPRRAYVNFLVQF
jgi:hypothetical protein